MYKNELLVEQDYVKAVNWYKLAAEQRVLSSQENIADIYLYGRGGVKQDINEAVKWYKLAARKGSTIAMSELAKLYRYGGRGDIKQDLSEALKWYKLLTNTESDPYWKYMVGDVYFEIYKDHVMAFSWLMKAAKEGMFEAQNRIGIMYLKGDGVLQNYEQAFKWFTQANNDFNDYAINNIGYMYARGLYVKQDYDYALHLFKKSMDNSYDNIVWILENVTDVDFTEHLAWIINAAAPTYHQYKGCNDDEDCDEEQEGDEYENPIEGSPYAQNLLGIMYRDGKGVEQNYVEALKWFGWSAELGHKKGWNNYNDLISKIKQEEIIIPEEFTELEPFEEENVYNETDKQNVFLYLSDNIENIN